MSPETVPTEIEIARVVRTVLVADLVESVRLMQDDESGTVQRWRGFVDHVVHRLLPGRGGRLVKSLGDGLMLEFSRASSAVSVAFAMQEVLVETNRSLDASHRLHLRIGIHVSPLIADEHDIYGHGVNLAARLMTLAGPDEIVVSADVRDQLTPALDADIEDLGECYVKHVQQPIRAFRVGAPGERPVIEPGNLAEDLRATIAVIPFRPRVLQPTGDVLGHLLADEVISALSHSPEVNVISRLSTSAFEGRDFNLEDVSAYLRANYMLSGSYHADADRVTLKADMAEARTMQVIWSQTLKGSIHDVIAGDDPLAGQLVSEACAAMMVRELQRSQGKAPQSLQSHTLLLSSIALMHRISPLAFERARQQLQVLIERTPRLASPYAWMAKWHVLRVTQGWSADPQADGQAAMEYTKRALDRDPTLSLAMTVEGQVNTYILKRLDVAEQLYAQALQSNPNDSLAWLLKGTLHAFRDEGKEAVRHTRHALKLSPLDPLKYYFDSLAATAALSAGQHQRALSLATRSLRLNRAHGSTLRVLIASLWRLGRHEEARVRAQELLKLDPAFRVSTFLERSPSAAFEGGKRVAEALELAGVPR
ncbi:MAG TPA: adenylate/guanylate cyclase domain-containing protein [Caldimonas sp.]|nr:adenylate/guanylate cyclase domain-containing protein [Caldimonas sp.]